MVSNIRPFNVKKWTRRTEIDIFAFYDQDTLKDLVEHEKYVGKIIEMGQCYIQEQSIVWYKDYTNYYWFICRNSDVIRKEFNIIDNKKYTNETFFMVPVNISDVE